MSEIYRSDHHLQKQNGLRWKQYWLKKVQVTMKRISWNLFNRSLDK